MAVQYNQSQLVLDGLTIMIDPHVSKGFGSDDFTKAPTRVVDNPGNRDAGEDVIVKHSQGPFSGAGYVSLDGTDDYLRIGSSSDFSFNTSSFTIEAWIYPTSLPESAAMICTYGVTTYGWNSTTGFEYSFYIGSNGDLNSNLYDGSTSVNNLNSGNSEISANTWQHVALCGNGSTTKIFINGVEKDTIDQYPRTVSSPSYFTIGSARPQNTTTNDFAGYISNLRVIKGTALYTSNFTPAGNLLEAVTNTKLLTCQGSSIADASSSGHSITAIGAAASVYPSLGSYVFDGNQGSLDQKIQFSSSLLNSNQNFTFSVWFEGSTSSGSILSGTIAGGLCIATWDSGSKIMIEEVGSPFGQGGQLAYSTNSLGIDDGQIHNIVVTRVGNTNANDLKIYHNGEGPVATTYTNSGGAQTLNSTNVNVIGSRYNSGATPSGHFQGKLYHICAYKRELTDSEIKQNFNVLRGRFGI